MMQNEATNIRNKQQRKDAIDKYYNDPNYCQYCGNIIHIGGMKVREVRRKKFCNISCSVSLRNKRNKMPLRIMLCNRCGNEIERKSYKDRRTVCGECSGSDIINRTKNQMSRSQIGDHARRVYITATKNLKCEVCNYEAHIEICHKKHIGEFLSNAKIGEINDISNLIGLCPNHHWELDHGGIRDLVGSNPTPAIVGGTE